MTIDRTGTVVNLAKALRFDLDRSTLTTNIQTATLDLLLNTIIELGEPKAVAMQQEHVRTVAERVAAFRGD